MRDLNIDEVKRMDKQIDLLGLDKERWIYYQRSRKNDQTRRVIRATFFGTQEGYTRGRTQKMPLIPHDNSILLNFPLPKGFKRMVRIDITGNQQD